MLGRASQSGAVRLDERTGVRESAAFVPRGVGDEQLFMCSHEPPGDPVGSVLICSSILADFLANYQREVNLARSLAMAGLTVVRFHYRGSGNSDGDPAEVTLSSLQADARWAAGELTTWLPELPIAFVGTRWGALSAAAAARDHAGAPLMLCEPMTDLPRFYQDAIRSRAMSAVATGKARKGVRQLSELLARDGYADIVGNVIHPALYESTIGVDARLLVDDGPARPGLLVQFGGKELRAPHRELEKLLVDNGWQVDAEIVDIVESWWFRAGGRTVAPNSLNTALGAWLSAQLQHLTPAEQR